MSKIFLISPPANEPRKTYPYSLVYLGSYLRKHGMENEIIDCDVLDMTVEGLVDRLSQEKATIVGMTGYTRYRFFSYQAARAIKKKLPGCIIVVGGRHFTALAEETLAHIPEIDAVVRGEGEITFQELCDRLLRAGSLAGIQGITYRENGRILSTPDRVPERDIEKFSYRIADLPDGPYHLREPVSLRKSLEITNPISVMTSRGCPGECVYCCLSAGRVRYRDPVAVVGEIQEKLRAANTDELGISDSSFTVNRNHLANICEEILRRGVRIRWSCQSRVNIDVEILKLMKKAGCVEISVGVESASPRVLRAIRKKINLDQVMNFLVMCKKLRISVLAYFMVSLPEETEEDAEETFRFIREITPYIFKPALQITQIYPDARLYPMAREKGLLPGGFDWFTPYTNPHVKDLGGRQNMPFYLEKIEVDYLKSYMSRYKDYYFRHFYYKDELKTHILRGLRSLLLDWENESLYRKLQRVRNGVRAMGGILGKQ